MKLVALKLRTIRVHSALAGLIRCNAYHARGGKGNGLDQRHIEQEGAVQLISNGLVCDTSQDVGQARRRLENIEVYADIESPVALSWYRENTGRLAARKSLL